MRDVPKASPAVHAQSCELPGQRLMVAAGSLAAVQGVCR